MRFGMNVKFDNCVKIIWSSKILKFYGKVYVFCGLFIVLFVVKLCYEFEVVVI